MSMAIAMAETLQRLAVSALIHFVRVVRQGSPVFREIESN